MIVGQRMVRETDGMRGQVVQNGPELRILYLDRGEERLALKTERWIADAIRPGPMRPEEKRLVALYADRALRAYERNEPLRWWEPPALTDMPYDTGLIAAIERYLSERETR